jgi:hypothetical protein
MSDEQLQAVVAELHRSAKLPAADASRALDRFHDLEPALFFLTAKAWSNGAYYSHTENRGAKPWSGIPPKDDK